MYRFMEAQQYKKLYTPQEVAAILQLNVITVYSYIKKKQLTAVKIGRNYRVTSSDLDMFIKSNKTD
jgi:excisionase family DNA binding protein